MSRLFTLFALISCLQLHGQTLTSLQKTKKYLEDCYFWEGINCVKTREVKDIYSARERQLRMAGLLYETEQRINGLHSGKKWYCVADTLDDYIKSSEKMERHMRKHSGIYKWVLPPNDIRWKYYRYVRK